MNTSAPHVPFDPALEPLVQQAIHDLAQRLQITADQIALIEANAVVWPDSSLGCPQPDMVYKQIPYDGALILLEVGGHRYEYHTGGSRGLFLCERTKTKKQPTPKIDLVNLPPNSSEDN